MFLETRLKDPTTIMRIGMACLLIALLWPRFVHATGGLSPDWIDGIRGMLFGVAIGMNLLSLTLTRRRG